MGGSFPASVTPRRCCDAGVSQGFARQGSEKLGVNNLKAEGVYSLAYLVSKEAVFGSASGTAGSRGQLRLLRSPTLLRERALSLSLSPCLDSSCSFPRSQTLPAWVSGNSMRRPLWVPCPQVCPSCLAAAWAFRGTEEAFVHRLNDMSWARK